jgi:TolB-like protein/Tfp pilus assembly protein PilF
MSSLKRFIAEIHRRSLWQVLGIYLAGAWLALQAADTLTASLGLPDWVPQLALILLIVFFPVVLATAFVQEGTGREEPPAEPHEIADSGLPDPAMSTEGTRESDGFQRVLNWRNVARAGVGGLALWGIVATAWLLLGSFSAPAGAGSSAYRASLAVLPFANRSVGEETAFFADGMHDDLLTQLSQVDSLKLISRTSVLRYRDTDLSVGEIAGELGIETILEGGVQRSGDRVRVNVQLIDARTDDHLWADSYEMELTAANLFAIQTDLVRRIAAALEATLSPEIEQRLDSRPTESLEAYDHYLEGRRRWNERSIAGLEAALSHYQAAIARDSLYALAYAGIADVFITQYSWDYLPWEEARPLATAALDRALELNPLLGEARVSRANLLQSGFDWQLAEREFRRALDLAPGYATGHHWHALLLAMLGRFDEAQAEIAIAAELDPLSVPISQNRGWITYLSRDFETAIEQLSRTIETDSTSIAGVYLADAYLEVGRHEEAVEIARRLAQRFPHANYHLWLSYALARSGQSAEARRVLEQQENVGDPTRIALVHIALGDVERAFDWLERAFDTSSPFLPELKVEPRYDPIRDDPRFGDMLRRIGLE